MAPPSDDATSLAGRALEFVPENAVVGLGTGHAAEAFLHALAERVKGGFRVRGVPTSVATEHLARRLGVPLVPIDDAPVIDIAVDGADEVGPNGDLIKGYGGALLREKVVASVARRFLVLVGDEKLVPVLGHRGRVPVEVVPFAAAPVARAVAGLGFRADVRAAGPTPLVTDNGNWILDLTTTGLTDPAGLDSALRSVPGVVGTGLFLGFRPTVLVQAGPAVYELELRSA